MIINEIAWVLLFVFLDLVYMAVSVSLTYVRTSNLMGMREQHPKAVDRVLRLIKQPYFSDTLRIGMVMIHLLLAGLVAFLVWRIGGVYVNIWLTLGVIILTALLVLGMEFIIEGLVLRNVETWAIRMLPAAQFIESLFKPLSKLFIAVRGSDHVLQHSMDFATEDEFKTWVKVGQSDGNLEEVERKMIYSIFQFRDTLCREIMVPRIDIFALEVNTTLPEAIQAVLQSGHSRFPVYDESIDNVIGLLYAKDLLQLDRDDTNSIRGILRPADFVPESKKVDELLREMQAKRVHMAVVIDEYGGMAGLVTLEDIVEEIVGEIRDEYDEKEELEFQQIGPDEYVFQGRIDLDDFNEQVGTHLTKDMADTLGGFIYGEITRVPVGGEEIEVEGWSLTVEKVSGRSIRTVRARRKPTLDEKEEDEKNESGR